MFDDEDEDDPLYRMELQAMYEEEMERSMEFAYEMIDQMGIERWSRTIPYGVDRKLRILKNMIHWYETREEYEKCAVLVKGIPLLEAVNK